MRLLIATQAVDLDDPILAFFQDWIREFAKRCEHVEVICLKKGRYELPKNVTVHSLGKEGGESNLKYVRRFLYYAWTLRNRYDTVFVHMNPEYVVLSGWLWRLLRKKVTLWYIHPRSSWRLFIARIFANHIVSATDKSFPLYSKKLIAVGHGIDTDFFSPSDVMMESETLRVMTAARLAPVKRIECIVGAISKLVSDSVPVSFDYYGSELPRDKEYGATIREMVPAAIPPDIWQWKGDASQATIRDAYRMHDVYVNATDSGSFDKAVFESMACGCITVVSNTALADVVPKELQFTEGDSSSLAETLARAAQMSQPARDELQKSLRHIAEEKYSLAALVGRIVGILVV